MTGKTDKRPDASVSQRALEEAAERRRQQEAKQRERELGGREGPDPARYGDWENKGIASDF